MHMRQFPTREASNTSSQVKNALHNIVSLVTYSISIDPKILKHYNEVVLYNTFSCLGYCLLVAF